MKPTYTIRAIEGLSMQTLYHGQSASRARLAIDSARGILILGKGSAVLTVSINGGGNSPVWTIQDGHASDPADLDVLLPLD